MPDVPTEMALPVYDVDETDWMTRENVYEQAVREAATMRDSSGIPVCWPDPQGDGTWVRFATLIKVAERDLDLEFPGRSRAARDYFRGRFKVRGSLTTPPNHNARVRADLVVGFHLDKEGAAV